jgi:MFS family permease
LNAVRTIKSVYFIITGLYTLSASLIWGINTLFLLDAGLNIQQVFIANAVFAGGMSLFEIPTGVFADTKGRRFSFLVSILVLLIATLGYVAVYFLGGGLFLFCIMSVFLGLGFTFYSGAVEAWLVDELNTAGYKDNLDTVFSQGQIVFGIAMLIGTISGGFLGTINLSLPFIVRSAALLILFFVALFLMKEKGFTPIKSGGGSYWNHVKRITRESIAHGWRKKSIRLFMITSFFLSAFMMWGFYAWQPYLLEMLGNLKAVWVSGFVAAGVSSAMILGNVLIPVLIRFIKRRTIVLTISTLLMFTGALGLGLAGNFWFALGFLLLLMISMGIFSPIKQAYFHQVIPSAQRATVISFDSLVGNLGSAGGQSGLGYISRRFSIGSGYIIGSIFIILVLPFLLLITRLKEEADKIK